MRGKIKEYIIITFGIFLVSIAIQYFYLPNNITGGGVTGIALVISNYIPEANLGILMGIMNIFLFVLAFIVIGSNFGGKTIYAAMGLSAMNWFAEEYINTVGIENNPMLATIAGSIILGIGLGVVFTQNASTGGTDIIAKILNKFFHIDMGKGMQIVDIIVVIFSAMTFGIEKGIYAALCVLINGIVIDKVIAGTSVCHGVVIFTKKTDSIKKFILEEIDRGCTIFNGTGGYTEEKKDVIYCVLGRSQLIKVKNYIRDNDKDAFIIVNDAHDVLGKGFGQIE